jgi:hypothetical protein
MGKLSVTTGRGVGDRRKPPRQAASNLSEISRAMQVWALSHHYWGSTVCRDGRGEPGWGLDLLGQGYISTYSTTCPSTPYNLCRAVLHRDVALRGNQPEIVLLDLPFLPCFHCAGLYCKILQLAGLAGSGRGAGGITYGGVFGRTRQRSTRTSLPRRRYCLYCTVLLCYCIIVRYGTVLSHVRGFQEARMRTRVEGRQSYCTVRTVPWARVILESRNNTWEQCRAWTDRSWVFPAPIDAIRRMTMGLGVVCPKGEYGNNRVVFGCRAL